MGDQSALGWKYDWLGNLEIAWQQEPETEAIERVARRQLSITDEESCTATFLAEGAFNKVYTVQHNPGEEYIMRIAAPVQPQLKTSSEVATIEYIRQHTDVPVPNILGFEATTANEIGFEWMLMDHVPGTKLGDGQWRSMSWLKKDVLVRKIVSYLAHLFNKRFKRLGNLYMTTAVPQAAHYSPTSTAHLVLLSDEQSCVDNNFCLGPIVDRNFFWGNHLNFNVHRGPYHSTQDWLHASLSLYLESAHNPVSVIADPDNASDLGSDDEPNPHTTPSAIKLRIQRLIKLLPTIFPEDKGKVEEFVLHHSDLHENNIFLDHNHDLSGIIDWECVPTVPLWAAAEIPKFLQTPLDRHLCVDVAEYAQETITFDDGTQNEEPCALFYEHLEEYEKTQLRAFFLQEMARLCPAWVEVYEGSKMKAAFGEIVATLSDRSNSQIVDEWLDAVEECGEAPSIGEMLHAYEQNELDRQYEATQSGRGKEKMNKKVLGRLESVASRGETEDAQHH